MAEDNTQMLDMMSERMGGLDPLDAPIPGQSLTQDPDQRMPYEKPPTFVDEDEALHEIFMRLTEEDQLDDTLDLMRAGIPVEDLAQSILFAGFQNGEFTPDLMLLLAEPTIYMLMSIAEVHGVEPELYPEEDFPESEEEERMKDEKATMSLRELLQKEHIGPKAAERLRESERDDPAIEITAGDVPRPPAETANTPTMLDAIRASEPTVEGE